MDVALSRRVALLTKTPIYTALSPTRRDTFIKALEDAPNFNALSTEWKQFILTAEKELQQFQQWYQQQQQRKKKTSEYDDGSLESPA